MRDGVAYQVYQKKRDDTEFLNQVQFDVLVLDDSGKTIRSLAQDEGRQFSLCAPRGQYSLDMTVKEDAGTVDYQVVIYGLALDWVVSRGTP